ncbi:glycosyltransferase family 4 protein [Labilibaculum antarcticum]|uniref:Glycosyltransferase family 4 protein n=1 Tax=Labilibaculum antarcticum TaxID=1717717 RepID=A0A1Y1CQB8_9BACT|nr:glycosyltransferase family 4 protein [Labilibaculum antarcticum]BAX82636.1 hypothetical protein ALGA_4346 [Labilibaculum antarcticum]
MKLLYITNQICGSGGLERVLSVKASYLAEESGYQVHILTLNQTGEDLFYDFSNEIHYHDISVGGNPFRYLYSYRKGIKDVLDRVKPDIISVCDDGLKGMLFPVIFGKKIPVVYERHVSKQIEFNSDKDSFLKKIWLSVKLRLMNYGGSKFHKFIVLTNGNLSEWDLKNLLVIPNPLPFNPLEKSTLNNKNVLVVGKQSYQKGYDRLLEIWEKVHFVHPDWNLEIYGKINTDLDLESKAEKLGLNSVVNFYPPVKNIQEKYKNSSIYLMTSRFEGFGMVLIEAMSYGVPCVSFDCPYGPADIVDDNINGFLVPNGNIDMFAEKLVSLIKDFDLRSRMGKCSSENVLRYNPEKIVKQWDVLFRSLILKK